MAVVDAVLNGNSVDGANTMADGLVIEGLVEDADDVVARSSNDEVFDSRPDKTSDVSEAGRKVVNENPLDGVINIDAGEALEATSDVLPVLDDDTGGIIVDADALVSEDAVDDVGKDKSEVVVADDVSDIVEEKDGNATEGDPGEAGDEIDKGRLVEISLIPDVKDAVGASLDATIGLIEAVVDCTVKVLAKDAEELIIKDEIAAGSESGTVDADDTVAEFEVGVAEDITATSAEADDGDTADMVEDNNVVLFDTGGEDSGGLVGRSKVESDISLVDKTMSDVVAEESVDKEVDEEVESSGNGVSDIVVVELSGIKLAYVEGHAIEVAITGELGTVVIANEVAVMLVDKSKFGAGVAEEFSIGVSVGDEGCVKLEPGVDDTSDVVVELGVVVSLEGTAREDVKSIFDVVIELPVDAVERDGIEISLDVIDEGSADVLGRDTEVDSMREDEVANSDDEVDIEESDEDVVESIVNEDVENGNIAESVERLVLELLGMIEVVVGGVVRTAADSVVELIKEDKVVTKAVSRG
ncbi:MAG: hypothetical protein M1817_001870 [Caeruleum heppii]|nr:MAG: hypothetical protein M1817_001870 [Caeruleum heppii]